MKSLEQQFSEDLSLTKSSNSVDTMIIQTISLLDECDKELYTYVMRVREWYGCHFPELDEIIHDNILYAKSVKVMGNRINAAKIDFSEILANKVEAKLKEAAFISKGIEVSDLELIRIRELCDQVILLAENRAQLYDNLKSRMNNVAPNLTALVGELGGARLISRGGSLMNLVKLPAYDIKSLFPPLLKKTHDTHKHGLIYRVSQAAPNLKKKMMRSLATKTALAIRCDVFGDGKNNTMGIESRAKLEAWLRTLKEKPKIKVAKFKTYDIDADSVLAQTPIKSETEAVDNQLVEEMDMI